MKPQAVNILIINGPNLNLLGKREPEHYGSTTLKDIEKMVRDHADELRVSCDFFQYNSEEDLVKQIQNASNKYHGIVINPAGSGYSSVSLRDAVISCGLPVVEVHLSNIHKRERFRHRTIIADVVTGQICGFKSLGYLLALTAVVGQVNAE